MANQANLDTTDIGTAMVAGESININVGNVQLLCPSKAALRSFCSSASGESIALEVRL